MNCKEIVTQFREAVRVAIATSPEIATFVIPFPSACAHDVHEYLQSQKVYVEVSSGKDPKNTALFRYRPEGLEATLFRSL